MKATNIYRHVLRVVGELHTLSKQLLPCLASQDEKKRIEALGGCVVWFGAWRVNGSLSVSRAIGKSGLYLSFQTCCLIKNYNFLGMKI